MTVKTTNEHLHASGGLRIPFEVADGITLAVLQEHIEMIRKEVNDHTEHGAWMHPEDYHFNMTKLIPALEVLIEYFGGSLE
jgi:hypothetical protein